MRFFTYFPILASVLFLSSANAYESFYARGVDYDSLFARREYDDLRARGFGLSQHYHRRSNFISEVTTRAIVDELGTRLTRRAPTNPDQQLAAVKPKSFSLKLVAKADKQDLSAFAKLAQTLQPSPDAGEGSGSPSSPKPAKLAIGGAEKPHGKVSPPASPVKPNANGNGNR